MVPGRGKGRRTWGRLHTMHYHHPYQMKYNSNLITYKYLIKQIITFKEMATSNIFSLSLAETNNSLLTGLKLKTQ
jgi:hypothetical protein